MNQLGHESRRCAELRRWRDDDALLDRGHGGTGERRERAREPTEGGRGIGSATWSQWDWGRLGFPLSS